MAARGAEENKVCVTPFERWSLSDPDWAVILRAYVGRDAGDTSENRRRAYEGVIKYYRGIGRLCEDPKCCNRLFPTH